MPRLPRAAALLLAALALGGLAAAGCKPSSLTPFWIGEQGAETPSPDDINGLWLGVGSAGEQVRFQVGSGVIADIRIQSIGACSRFFLTSETFQVEDNAFSFDYPLTSGGRVFVDGTFTSGDTCSGSYSFVGVSVIEGCPREGAGVFVATNTR